jgi:hypothetical protein
MKCHTNDNSTSSTQLPHQFSYIVAILGHNHFESPNISPHSTVLYHVCARNIGMDFMPGIFNATNLKFYNGSQLIEELSIIVISFFPAAPSLPHLKILNDMVL